MNSDTLALHHTWVDGRGANETRQLASYLNLTRSKLDSSELDSKC